MKHTRYEIIKQYLYAYFEEDKKWKKVLLKDNPYGYSMMSGKRINYVIPGEYGLLVEVWGIDPDKSVGDNNTKPIFEDTIPYDRISIDGALDLIIEIEKKGELVRTKLKHFLMPAADGRSTQNGRH